MITDLTQLSLRDLQFIARNSGYKCDDWRACEFDKITISGNVVYKISYRDGEGELAEGVVYVFMRAGRITLDF